MDTRMNRFYDPYSINHAWNPFPFSDYHFETPYNPPYHDPYYNNITAHSSFPNNSSEIEWKETPEAHVYKINLPGYKKEDVKVHVEDGNILKIIAEKIVEKQEINPGYGYGYQVRRSKSVFTDKFMLPANARADHLKSLMEYGVLTITIPKRDVKDHHVQYIKVE